MSIKMDRTQKTEQMKLISFELFPDGSIEAADCVLEVPIFTGPVAKAAMLKGLNEYFLKVLSSNGENELVPETLKQIDDMLERFRVKAGANSARSKLILP